MDSGFFLLILLVFVTLVERVIKQVREWKVQQQLDLDWERFHKEQQEVRNESALVGGGSLSESPQVLKQGWDGDRFWGQLDSEVSEVFEGLEVFELPSKSAGVQDSKRLNDSGSKKVVVGGISPSGVGLSNLGLASRKMDGLGWRQRLRTVKGLRESVVVSMVLGRPRGDFY